MRLGKLEYKHDPRTMFLSDFIASDVPYPCSYDFDKRRAPFQAGLFGNDRWGDCVMVGRANQLLRLERLETHRTIPLFDEHVIEEYKRLSEMQHGTRPNSPGDPGDRGLIVLDAIKSWRNEGWTLKFRDTTFKYSIAAYGELEPADSAQLRRAIFLLHGVQLGFSLPRAVQGNTETWEWHGETDLNWKPGSWGGHLVFAKAYKPGYIQIRTWGRDVWVSDAFVSRFCDEAWAVVDSLDAWRNRPEFDIQALLKTLRDIGARVDN